MLSSIRFLLSSMSLTWSNVAISAALMIEFLTMFGPTPVHRPANLNNFKKIPLSFNYFDVCFSDTFISPFMNGFISLALEPDFDDIGRIGNHDSYCSGSQGCQNSGKNGDWSHVVFSNVQSFDWLVKSDTQTRKYHLPLETGIETFI